MKTRILILTTLALLAFAGSAFAVVSPPSVYADSVVAYNPTSGVASARADATNALGAPDPIISSSGINFVSLGIGSADTQGIGGSIILDFGTHFTGSATIYETTYEPRTGYNEYADVYGLNVDTGSWDFLGTVNNQPQGSGDYDGYTLDFLVDGIFSQMKIVDTTFANGGANGDGFDVNAVAVTPTPIPGAALLLGSGLVGLVGLRRRFND